MFCKNSKNGAREFSKSQYADDDIVQRKVACEPQQFELENVER